MNYKKSEYEFCHDSGFRVPISKEVWDEMKSYDKWLKKNIKDNTFYIVTWNNAKWNNDRKKNFKKVKGLSLGKFSVVEVKYKNIEVSPFCKIVRIMEVQDDNEVTPFCANVGNNETCAIVCYDNEEFVKFREKNLEDLSNCIRKSKLSEGKMVFCGDSCDNGYYVFTNPIDAYESIIDIYKNNLEFHKKGILETESVIAKGDKFLKKIRRIK